MSAIVVHLAVAEPATAAPVEAVVEHLRDLLARAEAGEIRAVSIVARCSDGSIEYGTTRGPACDGWAPLLAGLACLQADLVGDR